MYSYIKSFKFIIAINMPNSIWPGSLYVLLLRHFADLLGTPSGSNAFIRKRTALLSIMNTFSLNLQSITLQPKEDEGVVIFVRINYITSFNGVFCFPLQTKFCQ